MEILLAALAFLVKVIAWCLAAIAALVVIVFLFGIGVFIWGEASEWWSRRSRG